MDRTEEAIEVEFEYTAKDAVAAGLWVFFRIRGMRVIYVILTIVGLAAAVAVMQGRNSGQTPFLLVVAFYVMLPTVVAMAAFLNQRKMSSERRKNRYCLSPEGVNIATGVGEASLSWAAFQRARESRGAFYLAPHPGLWHFLPKRAFNSKSDIERVRQLLIEALGERAHVRRGSSTGS